MQIILIMGGAFVLITALSFVILFIIMFLGEMGKIIPFKEGKYVDSYAEITALNGTIVHHKTGDHKMYAPEITYYNKFMKATITKMLSNASIPDPEVVKKQNIKRKKQGLEELYVPKYGDKIKIQYTAMKVRVSDERIINENTYSLKPHFIRIGCASVVSIIGLILVLIGIYIV